MATVRLKAGRYAAIVNIDWGEWKSGDTLIEVAAESAEEAKEWISHYYGDRLISCTVAKVPSMIFVLE